jgi:glutamate/tyrosine decarboxylase-like PLP-dependent enzyme
VPTDPLGLDAEAMRQLGYQTVDALVDWLGDETAPPLRRATPDEMRERLGGPPPEQPESFDTILAGLRENVLPFASRVHHPAFFAFIPGSGTWPGALGDFVASAANLYAGSWMESAGPSQVELEVLGWFRDWLGLPAGTAGTLLSGGSAANITAVACARESVVGAMRDEIVVYVSDQAHSSVARAARMLGLRPHQLRVLPVDGTFRLEPRTLADAIDADMRNGRRPLLAIVSAGTTNTGAVDPLRELAAVCDRRGVWLHVDAAYGAFAVLTKRGRAQLEGIELADSVTLDPHKWLYQPYECGCLLVRDGEQLRRAFEVHPDYLTDADSNGVEVNFADLGLQLTRATRALKLWVSLRYFGLAAFREAIDRSLDLAELARRRVEENPVLELAAPPSLGIVCFRRRFEDCADGESDSRNTGLAAALERSGTGLVSTTLLRGRCAIRLCALNHTSRPEDVERVIDFLASAEPAALEPRRQVHSRDRESGLGWLRSPGVEPATLGSVSLFEALDPDELERASRLGLVREAAPGERIVDRWETSREFYVLLDGAVNVLVDDALVGHLKAGDFFGELAALDWGAGFGYPRLATVVAVEPSRLLVFGEGALAMLVSEFPSVGSIVRTAAAERAARH